MAIKANIGGIFHIYPLELSWHQTSSTIAGGRGCNIFVPVLGGNSTKIAPAGDMLDQPPGQMR